MERQRYPSDLTDAEWQRIEPLIPPASQGGRPRTVYVREIINAICYLQQTRCSWRAIPGGFPRPSSVRHYYDRWRFDGTWERIQRVLRDETGSERRALGSSAPRVRQECLTYMGVNV